MFSQLSVCSEGICLPTMPWAGRPPPLPQKADPHKAHPPQQADPRKRKDPPQKADLLLDTVNRRVVRIRLECILVILITTYLTDRDIQCSFKSYTKHPVWNECSINPTHSEMGLVPNRMHQLQISEKKLQNLLKCNNFTDYLWYVNVDVTRTHFSRMQTTHSLKSMGCIKFKGV